MHSCIGGFISLSACVSGLERSVLLVQLLTNHGRLDARPVAHLFQKPSRLHKVPLHHENDDEE